MRVVSTFMYSEPHEEIVLFLRLFHESPRVDEWVLVENDYTHRGEYKGFSAEKVMSSELLKPYKDRVTILQFSLQSVVPDHTEAFYVERAQRNHALGYIREHYAQGDWILIADIDEFIDFTDPERESRVLSIFEHSKEHVCLPLMRYAYDFDNYSYRHCYRIFPFSSLRNSIEEMIDGRMHEDSNQIKKEVVAFEYTHCYPKETIRRKLKTNAHGEIGADPRLLDEALHYNWHMLRPHTPHPPPPTQDPNYWYETLKLTEHNSPSYVRDHLEELKTHNVDVNYKQNRKERLPEWF